MDISMLNNIISDIDNPAIVFGHDGEIVCKNKHFEKVYEYLDIDEIESVGQVKVERNDSDIQGVNYFRIEDTHLRGTEHFLKLDDSKRYNLYIFERTFILDELISNVIEHIDEIVVVFDE